MARLARPAEDTTNENGSESECGEEEDELPELATLLRLQLQLQPQETTTTTTTTTGNRRVQNVLRPKSMDGNSASSPTRRSRGATAGSGDAGASTTTAATAAATVHVDRDRRARGAVTTSGNVRGAGSERNRVMSAICLPASSDGRSIALLPPVSPTKTKDRKAPEKAKQSSPAKKSDARKAPAKRGSSSQRPDLRTERDGGGAETSMMMLQRQRALKLGHVDSLLFPLSQVALDAGGCGSVGDPEVDLSVESRANVKVGARRRPEVGAVAAELRVVGGDYPVRNFDSKAALDRTARNTRRTSPKRAAKEKATYLSRFILKEARCNDDDSDSDVQNEEEETTDLSGFIVDDDAELSFHGSDSDTSGDSDAEREKKNFPKPARERRLQRTRRNARTVMESEEEYDAAAKEDVGMGDVVHDLFSLKLNAPNMEQRSTRDIEMVDLTYSPPKIQAEPRLKSERAVSRKANPSPTKRSSSDTNPFLSNDTDRLLKFSPPLFGSSAKVQGETYDHDVVPTETCRPPLEPLAPDATQRVHTYTTPPATPPASPTKLKSPSKLLLLSPSKRGAAIPTSPHRQSIDAFWCSNEINSRNDQYSPHKPPLTISPKKRGLARLLDFDIWSDSDNNEDANVSRDGDIKNNSSSDPPTPTRSPSPGKTRKSPSKPSIASKKALAEARRTFEATRHTTAQSLLTHLDTHVTSGKLSALSASTGGVRILWSKNLRSTAGRANWRRTVTKPPPGPLGPLTAGSAPQTLVQHYASIELAEKVIDSDARLVNTLAHEFCHLANFMVSGVRDQPHGASFKAWADKVSKHLRTTPDLPELYRSVEVTTKHSYVINHKYLWVCAGQKALPGSAQAAARAFLALEDDPGCGAEYGRHSKSIDPEKHRCGKCKGLLIQVRPMPKLKSGKAECEGKSPSKAKCPSRAKRRVGLGESKEGEGGRGDRALEGLEKALEYVNLSD